MAEPSLDFIGRQLQSIQAELQQIKFAADVDRRNTASQYDNLVAAVGLKIGAFAATMEHRLNALGEELNPIRNELNVLSDGFNALSNGFNAFSNGFNALREELLGRFERIEQLLNKA
jgi:hypothetical protein